MPETSREGGGDYQPFSDEQAGAVPTSSSSVQNPIIDEHQPHQHQTQHRLADDNAAFGKWTPQSAYDRLQAKTWKVLNGPVNELENWELWLHWLVLASVVAFITLVSAATHK